MSCGPEEREGRNAHGAIYTRDSMVVCIASTTCIDAICHYLPTFYFERCKLLTELTEGRLELCGEVRARDIITL